MDHGTIVVAFNISLFVLIPLGMAVIVWWTWKFVWRRAVRALENYGLNAMYTVILVTMLPGIALFVLMAVPAFYFGHLLKQEDHCRELIRVNDLKPNDPLLAKRCGALDIKSLYGAGD